VPAPEFSISVEVAGMIRPVCDTFAQREKWRVHTGSVATSA